MECLGGRKLKFLFKNMWKYKWLVIMSFILVSISVLSQLVQPELLKSIIESIVTNDTTSIARDGGLLVAIAVFGLVAGVVNTIISAKIAQNTGATLREAVFNKVQTFSFSTIEKFSASNLVVRLTNDTVQAQNLVMIVMQSLTRIPLLFIGSLILGMRIMPQFWWMIVLVMVLVILVVMISFGIMGPKFGKIQTLLERVNTLAKENFTGMRVVKSFVQEDAEIKKFGAVSKQLTKETIDVGVIFSIMMPTFFFIMDGASFLVIMVVGKMAETDPAVIGASVAFVSYLVMIMMAMMIGGMMTSFASRAIVSMQRIEEVLHTETELLFPETGAEIANGTVTFDHVSFTYDGDEAPTLKDVSFTVQAGETVGVIGATGSAKTTLAQLIARIYDPSEGSIQVDGRDLKAYPETTLREHIALVLQRPILFSGTIADNIRQGNKHATQADLERAAEIAQAAEFIANEENGYEAEVYQRGANFSGGQKQRISIARGIVGNPKILILDDSTSALDARSEKKVKEAIMAQMPDTTKVIISQKISSIVHADVILVLDEGRLVEQGTHKELVANSAIYQEIYTTQKGKEV